MREESSHIQFNEVLTGRGDLRSGEEEASVTRFRLSRRKHDPRSAWEFELFVAGEEERRDFERRVVRSGKPPSFRGETATGHAIEVPQLIWTRWSNGILSGTARELILDAEELPELPREQTLLLELSPTVLALPEKRFLSASYTGEIMAPPHLEEIKDSPLYWETSLGRATLALRYVYEDALVGESQSLVRIPVPTVSWTLQESTTVRELKGLATRLLDEVEHPLRLVSYLSRRHVRWTSLRVVSVLPERENRRAIHEMLWLRAGVLHEVHVGREPLVNPHNMTPDGLRDLTSTLLQSRYREVLIAAMVYLISALDAPFVESSMLDAFTALETLTNGINSIDKTDQALGASQFGALRTRIKDVIRTYADECNIEENTFEAITAKLPELNRLPVVPKILKLLIEYGVEWKDLWSGRSLEEGVRALFRVRNQFVHMGRIQSVGHAEIAARRAQILGERLVYRMLAAREQWLELTSYSNVADLIAWERALDDSSPVPGQESRGKT